MSRLLYRMRIIFLLAIGLQIAVAQPVAMDWQQRERLAPGLHWQYAHTGLHGAKQSINVLKINTRKRDLALAYITDTLLQTSELARKSDALAAVNAGFFKIREGKGSATYLRVDGETVDNLPTQEHDLLRGALIIDERGRLQIEYAQAPAVYNENPATPTVLVTGPVLRLNGEAEPLLDKAFNNDRHPRTCACIVRKHKVLLVTVDGRHAEAAGMSLHELTDLLESLKCKSAINLDGGGSTTMWLRSSGVVNYPSDNKQFDHAGERACANAIIVR
jgi:exopolysaccharide biosynthesis protein